MRNDTRILESSTCVIMLVSITMIHNAQEATTFLRVFHVLLVRLPATFLSIGGASLEKPDVRGAVREAALRHHLRICDIVNNWFSWHVYTIITAQTWETAYDCIIPKFTTRAQYIYYTPFIQDVVYFVGGPFLVCSQSTFQNSLKHNLEPYIKNLFGIRVFKISTYKTIDYKDLSIINCLPPLVLRMRNSSYSPPFMSKVLRMRNNSYITFFLARFLICIPLAAGFSFR
ncbi:hypothetical protein ACJX0J_023877 [Zea mays]